MKSLALLAAGVLAAGCVAKENAPLVFGQTIVLGVSVGGSAAGATPDFTLGYKDANFAIVPTIANSASDESQTQVTATVGPSTDQSSDALSTFGQFNGSAQGSQVGLEKFFATGLAAQKLADGFACAVSRGVENRCDGGSLWSYPDTNAVPNPDAQQ